MRAYNIIHACLNCHSWISK